MNHRPVANQTPEPVSQLLIIATAAVMGLNFAFALVHSRIDSGEWSFAIGSAIGGALMVPVVFMLLLQIPRKFRNDRSRYITMLAVSSLMLFGSYPQIKRLIQTGSTASNAATADVVPLTKMDPKTFAEAGLSFTTLPSPAWISDAVPNANKLITLSRRFTSSDDSRTILVIIIRNPYPSADAATALQGFKTGFLKPGMELKSEAPVKLGDTQGTLMSLTAKSPNGPMSVQAYHAVNPHFIYTISLSRMDGEVTDDAELRAFASTIRINRLP